MHGQYTATTGNRYVDLGARTCAKRRVKVVDVATADAAEVHDATLLALYIPLANARRQRSEGDGVIVNTMQRTGAMYLWVETRHVFRPKVDVGWGVSVQCEVHVMCYRWGALRHASIASSAYGW